MLDTVTRVKTHRFDQMAQQINDRVDNPAESGVERYVGLEHLDADSLRIRRWGEITDVQSTKLRFQPGDIIFGKRRVYQRKLAVANFEGICSAHAMVLRAKPEIVLPEFLPFFMQSDCFMERALEISVGSLSPTINWKTLAVEEFSVPPIDEQRRVARALRAVDGLLGALEEVCTRVAGARCAYLEHMLAGDLSDLTPVSVGDLLIEGPRNGLSPKTNADGRGIRTVSISAVSHGLFVPDGNIKHVHVDTAIAEPYLVKAGDIFAVRGNGNRQLTGKAGIAKSDYRDLIYPDLLIRLRFDPRKILREFALAIWNLPSIHARLIASAKSSNGIWKVNGQDIRAHELPVPPLRDQEAILENLQEMGDVARSASTKRECLVSVKARLSDALSPGNHE